MSPGVPLGLLVVFAVCFTAIAGLYVLIAFLVLVVVLILRNALRHVSWVFGRRGRRVDRLADRALAGEFDPGRAHRRVGMDDRGWAA